jgi:hypothetical protein
MIISIRPPEDLWKGTCIKFQVTCGADYPHSPPVVLCITKLYHPNIGLDGKVCLNILRVGHTTGGVEDGWKPVFTLYTVIMGFFNLFSAADPKDPLNIGEHHSHCPTPRPGLVWHKALSLLGPPRARAPRCAALPLQSMCTHPTSNTNTHVHAKNEIAGAATEMRENLEQFKRNVKTSLAGGSIRISIIDGSGQSKAENVSFPNLMVGGAGGGASGGGGGGGGGGR